MCTEFLKQYKWKLVLVLSFAFIIGSFFGITLPNFYGENKSAMYGAPIFLCVFGAFAYAFALFIISKRKKIE